MPRDLGDVIHHFIPEAGAARPSVAPELRAGAAPQSVPVESASAESVPCPLHVVGVPMSEGDVLRAAFAWNLSVELARAGAEARLIAPRSDAATAAWPAAGEGPLGSMLDLADAADGRRLAELAAAANSTASAPGRGARRTRCTLVCIPEAEIEKACASPSAPQRWLLLCSPVARSLREARDLVLRLGKAQPGARIGATIHGVRSIDEARAAFDALGDATDAHIDPPLESYGLVADDLHLYRAIVAGRPIGLAHPQSPAARALADVARLLLEDLRETPNV